MILRELVLDSITVDFEINQRDRIHPEIITEYTQLMQEEVEFPPIIVFQLEDINWLADGFHRMQAAKQAGLATIKADVYEGTRRDALLFACGANAEHGIQRTQADKHNAVMTLLNDSEWGKWSDREIARRCKVNHKTVAKIRNEHTGEIPSMKSERTFIHHKTGLPTTMNVANIGKTQSINSPFELPLELPLSDEPLRSENPCSSDPIGQGGPDLKEPLTIAPGGAHISYAPLIFAKGALRTPTQEDLRTPTQEDLRTPTQEDLRTPTQEDLRTPTEQPSAGSESSKDPIKTKFLQRSDPEKLMKERTERALAKEDEYRLTLEMMEQRIDMALDVEKLKSIATVLYQLNKEITDAVPNGVSWKHELLAWEKELEAKSREKYQELMAIIEGGGQEEDANEKEIARRKEVQEWGCRFHELASEDYRVQEDAPTKEEDYHAQEDAPTEEGDSSPSVNIPPISTLTSFAAHEAQIKRTFQAICDGISTTKSLTQLVFFRQELIRLTGEVKGMINAEDEPESILKDIYGVQIGGLELAFDTVLSHTIQRIHEECVDMAALRTEGICETLKHNEKAASQIKEIARFFKEVVERYQLVGRLPEMDSDVNGGKELVF